MTAVFKIIPTTQKYDWGKVGLSSKVAQYASAGKLPGFTLDEKAPYAEVSTSTASSDDLVPGLDWGGRIIRRARHASRIEGRAIDEGKPGLLLIEGRELSAMPAF